jgi:hypothetical protein
MCDNYFYIWGVDLEVQAVFSALFFRLTERHALDHTLPGVDVPSGRSDLRTSVPEAGGCVQYACPGLNWLWGLEHLKVFVEVLQFRAPLFHHLQNLPNFFLKQKQTLNLSASTGGCAKGIPLKWKKGFSLM